MNPIYRFGRLSLLSLGITTTAVAQTILLDQSNFVQQLNNSNPNLNSSFRLIEDITLPPNWIWTPVGTEDSPASLKFNGSYHAISGLNVITTENNTPTAMFGYLVDSWVYSVILNLPSVISHGDGSETATIAGRVLRTNITNNIVAGGSVETRGDVGSPAGRNRYSYAGGLTGSASHSRIENNLNNATVYTTGNYCHASGITARQKRSITSNNLNMGNVEATGLYAYASGITAYQEGSSTTSNNMNMGGIKTAERFAYASGITAYQEDSTTSDNINTGAIGTGTAGGGSYASGVTARQRSSTTSNNINRGAIGTTADSAYTSGITADQRSSTTSNNLNVGNARTTGKIAHTSGITAYQEDSTTSNNLNMGDIETTGKDAFASGITADQRSNSITSNNLNLGDVRTTGQGANAGGAIVDQEGSSTSGNLNTGSPNAALGVVNPIGFMQLTERLLRMFDGLDESTWNSGDDSQFPMLRDINAAYRDLRRINGTRYGKNAFPVELNEFADPGGFANASLFDLAVWNVRDGYLPFPKAVGRAKAVSVGIDCFAGGFACNCLFTPYSSGTIGHLLYDGQRYHGIVRDAASGLAYWAEYESGQQVALEPCDVYSFPDLSSSGVLVDAVANDGDTAYVAYRVPGQAQSPMLAVFSLNGQQLVSSSPLALDQVVGLSVDAGNSSVLVNTGQGVCRLLVADTGQLTDCGNDLTGQDERIVSVAGNGGDLYLLTYENEVGYRIKTVPEDGSRDFFGVWTARTGQGEIPPTLKVIGQYLHLLLVDKFGDRFLVVWRQYPLDALPVMFDDFGENEVLTAIPRDITPTGLSLIAGTGQQTEVFVLGHEAGQPRYIRLAADVCMSSTDASNEAISNINKWPWWVLPVVAVIPLLK